MEKPTFTRANLSNIRVIMMIMRILVEELCETVMGWIPVLECLLLHPIMLDIKWHGFLRTRL
jgi:hypothetical protein